MARPKKEETPDQTPEDAARQAELDRQEAQIAAVAKANEEDLPKLGGPTMNPGGGEEG